jgi:ferritin
MLKKNIEAILNDQLSKEAYASQLYLSMASWAETQGYEGISNWFYAQAEEERMHMMKFVRFINERGGHAIIPKVDQPPKTFKTIMEVFKASLEHEQFVTESIYKIVDLALSEKDHATHNWIQWFVFEQVEEEASVQSIIDKLNLLGDKNVYIFDRDIMSMRGE